MPNKLGRSTTQRMALLKGQVTNLLWYGKIETTFERAKSVSAYADKVLTLAIDAYEDKVKYDKVEVDKKGREITVDAYNDGVKKLNARRRIMSKLYEVQEPRLENETDEKYAARTKGIKHPLIEKIFNELAPKYDARAKELNNQRGGYTRIVKLGARRGDAAEMALIELV